MENITRTVFSSYLQTALLMDLPFRVLENTTLNEKFNIQSGVFPAVTDIPVMKYFSVGNGGHRISVGANGIPKPEPVQHRATDAALYNHLPFVLREVTNDISVSDRLRYALRRVEIHNNVQYIAYYLRRMDLTNVVPAMEYVTTADGTTTVTEFIPTAANLNPQPPVLAPDGVNIVTGDYATASAKVALLLDSNDVLELLNVAKVIYDDEAYAIISEVALCAGVDKTVQSSSGGNAVINFNEAIAVQVCSFINSFFPLKYSNQGIGLNLDVGSSEPLFNLSSL